MPISIGIQIQIQIIFLLQEIQIQILGSLHITSVYCSLSLQWSTLLGLGMLSLMWVCYEYSVCSFIIWRDSAQDAQTGGSKNIILLSYEKNIINSMLSNRRNILYYMIN